MKQDSELQKISLKKPLMAALLSFVLPGAGHFYQGRTFKGIINCVCVMTLLFWGLSLGDWGIVFHLEPLQANERDNTQLQGGFQQADRFTVSKLEPDEKNTKLHLGFLAQAPIGLVSIPALIQEKRYFSQSNISGTHDEFEMNEAAGGEFTYQSKEEKLLLQGMLQLAPQQGEFGREMQGIFTGSDPQGNQIELTIERLIAMGPPIGAEHNRPLTCDISHMNGQPIENGKLEAFVERGLFDRLFVPPNIESLEKLHGKLGKVYSLAEVFTWIAGLLNVLVIWDAYAGPAYGYRMPRPEELNENDEKQDEQTGTTPETAASAPAPQTTA